MVMPDIPLGLQDDPEILAAAKRLLLRSIDSATEILNTASPAIQLQMVRILLPTATRALANRPEEVDQDMRDKLDAMNEAVRNAIDTPGAASL